jgi:taurine dioxygenase
MTLSNIVENGRPLGLADAGQDWHTDMSYSRGIAFANVLYGIRIPRATASRSATRSSATCTRRTTACRARSKTSSEGKTVLHDFDKFWEKMRRAKGSTRAPLTPRSGREAARVASRVPYAPDHRRKVLYANPATRSASTSCRRRKATRCSNSCSSTRRARSTATRTRGTESDVLVWDDFGTIHNAIADYGPNEHRLIKRCQVMATRFFNSGEPDEDASLTGDSVDRAGAAARSATSTPRA